MQESSRDGGQLKRLCTERWGFCYGTGCLPFLSHTSSQKTDPCLKLSNSHSFPTNYQSSTSLPGAISLVVCLIDRRHLTIDWSPCSSHVASQQLSALSSLRVAPQTLATRLTPCRLPAPVTPGRPIKPSMTKGDEHRRRAAHNTMGSPMPTYETPRRRRDMNTNQSSILYL